LLPLSLRFEARDLLGEASLFGRLALRFRGVLGRLSPRDGDLKFALDLLGASALGDKLASHLHKLLAELDDVLDLAVAAAPAASRLVAAQLDEDEVGPLFRHNLARPLAAFLAEADAQLVDVELEDAQRSAPAPRHVDLRRARRRVELEFVHVAVVV